ncbi:class I SAM-dependent methyltransferase [Asticcacaulis sp. YBE204]|uniref:class I SAM-dependent methyltransferase n=1 Tax=Asticcacaulis sp. YBE204 TaxID=1282363 RepID=UPI0003C3BBD1|nr:class I SAM-dependent methyltransferase [Asticcacaulis sp. YBE204]ESQ81318.1 SAM-dependent methyltransferase [Asticcacaulis sp. YBE204]
MTSAPRLFDRQLLRRRIGRAASGFSAANFLKTRSIEDILDTLSAVNRRFGTALEIGSRDGSLRRALLENSLVSEKIDFIIETDLSDQNIGQVVLDEEALPFGDDTLDLVVSALAFHSTNDLPGVLVQIRRALRPDGLLIASQFGGETLRELRTVLMEAELEVRGGSGARIAPFAESYDCVDLLKRAGFNMPVVDTDKVVVAYAHPLNLLRDLRAMGETNILHDRPRKGLNRAILNRAFELYAERFPHPEGGVRATFEIITLSGWTPHESQQKPLQPGSAKVRLADALSVKEGRL